jgi:hypothetical protein
MGVPPFIAPGTEDETPITLFAYCKGISRELGLRYRGTISTAKFVNVSRSARGVRSLDEASHQPFAVSMHNEI